MFSNKKFVKNITDFTSSLFKKSNDKRLKSLEKVFSSQKLPSFKEKKTDNARGKSTKISVGGMKNLSEKSKEKITSADLQANGDLVKRVTGGFGKTVKNFIDEKVEEKEGRKTLVRLFQERLSKNISGTVKHLKHVKYKTLRGIVTVKKNLNPKGLFKLTGFLLFGTIRIFKNIVFGLFKGLFSLVKGIFKLGINIVKGTFKLMTGVVSSIYKVSKKVTKGLLKLTGGFLGRIKAFFLTPQGAYLTGFVIGWVSARIREKYKQIKEKIEDIKHDIQWKFHKIRMSIWKEIGDNTYIKRIHELLVVKNKFSSFQIQMIKATRFLRNFSFMKAVASFGGGVIGAWVGRLVGTAVGSFFAVPSLGAGLGTGLGYIAGDLIGKYFASVPQKTDAQTQKERNLITRTITDKYKQKRQRKVDSMKGLLSGKVKDIDKEISKIESKDEKVRTDEEKRKLAALQAERNKWSGSLELLSGGKLIGDEDDTERHHNDEVIQKLTDLIMKEEENLKVPVRDRILSIFSEGLLENHDYSLNGILNAVANGKFEMTKIGNKIHISERSWARLKTLQRQ